MMDILSYFSSIMTLVSQDKSLKKYFILFLIASPIYSMENFILLNLKNSIWIYFIFFLSFFLLFVALSRNRRINFYEIINLFEEKENNCQFGFLKNDFWCIVGSRAFELSFFSILVILFGNYFSYSTKRFIFSTLLLYLFSIITTKNFITEVRRTTFSKSVRAIMLIIFALFVPLLIPYPFFYELPSKVSIIVTEDELKTIVNKWFDISDLKKEYYALLYFNTNDVTLFITPDKIKNKENHPNSFFIIQNYMLPSGRDRLFLITEFYYEKSLILSNIKNKEIPIKITLYRKGAQQIFQKIIKDESVKHIEVICISTDGTIKIYKIKK